MNLPLLIHSLLVATATAVGALAVGSLVAMAALGCGTQWRRAWIVTALVALALPPFVLANAWLDLVGLTAPRADGALEPRRLASVVVLLTGLFWPLGFLLLDAAWQRLQREHLEVEVRLRGLSLLRWLLVPSAARVGALILALVFVLALNQFSIPALLQLRVYPAEVWVRFNTSLDASGALAASWPMLAAPLVLLVCLRGREVQWPRRSGVWHPGLFRARLGRGAWGAVLVGAVVTVVITPGLPFAGLLANGRTWAELGTALAAGGGAVSHSFLLAAATATTVVGLALLLARFRWPSVLWLLFLAPGVLLGIGLILLLNRPAFEVVYGGLGIVLLAWGLRFLAPAWQAVRAGLRAVDRNLVDAARLDGAPVWMRGWLVYWPQAGRMLVAAWYAVYLLCLWDTETLLLVMPAGGETLALRIFNLLHYGHNGQVNALCLVLLCLALAPWILAGVAVALMRVCSASTRLGRSDRSPVFGWVLPAASVLLLAGCSVRAPGGAPGGASGEVAIQSAVFSGARAFGTRGAGLGQFNKPRSVAVDAQDNVYVVDLTGRVQKFSPEGAFLSFWQMPESPLGKPKGMARDEKGNIVVLEPHYCRVNHFSPEGHLVEQWGRRGTDIGEMAFPRAVAVAPDGRVYVSEYMQRERVQIFLPGTRVCERAFGEAGGGEGQFNRAEGVALDVAGRVYVADSCNHRVQVFDSDGRFLRAYGEPGDGAGQLSYPYDIAIDRQGRQYVCEFGNSRIQVFDAQGRSVEILGGPGAEPGRFNNPWSVALDSHGNLYVADSMNHRVQKLVRRVSTRDLP